MMLHFVFFSRFFRFFLLMFYFFFLFRFFRRFLLLVFCRKFFFVFINKYTNRLSTPDEFTPNWKILDTICISHLRNWFFLYWFITNLFVFAVVTVRWMLMLWRLFVVDDYRLYFLLNLCAFFFYFAYFFIYTFGFSLLKIAKIYCEKKRKIRVHLNGLSILFFFLLVTIWPFLWAARDLVFFFLLCVFFSSCFTYNGMCLSLFVFF